MEWEMLVRRANILKGQRVNIYKPMRYTRVKMEYLEGKSVILGVCNPGEMGDPLVQVTYTDPLLETVEQQWIDPRDIYELNRPTVDTSGKWLSPWIADPEYPHCSMRIVEGGDWRKRVDRIAYIEKTARVRVAPWTKENDFRNWEEIARGHAPEYGEYEPARQAADARLIELGYKLG